MPKYKVEWIKTYYVSGTKEIEANNRLEAENIAHADIGDWQGAMQYDPDKNYVDAVALDKRWPPSDTKNEVN